MYLKCYRQKDIQYNLNYDTQEYLFAKINILFYSLLPYNEGSDDGRLHSPTKNGLFLSTIFIEFKLLITTSYLYVSEHGFLLDPKFKKKL
jgi:hypothetical protein